MNRVERERRKEESEYNKRKHCKALNQDSNPLICHYGIFLLMVIY